KLEHSVVPGERPQIHEQRPRRVRHIGRVLAPGQAPDQKAVDRSERELTSLGPLAGAGYVVEEPSDLRSAEVRVENEAGHVSHLWLVAPALQRRAAIARAPILPDDRAMNRPSRRALPDERRFALVGDPDGSDTIAFYTGNFQRIAHGIDDARPDL